MIPFRSIDDLTHLIFRNMHCLPSDMDLVVGIPRSGMIPASLISLLRDVPLLSLDAFLLGSTPMGGKRTGWGESYNSEHDFRKVVIVDDSCNSGTEMARVKTLLTECYPQVNFYYVAIFSSSIGAGSLDNYFELLEYPRLFEWNILNHPLLKDAGVDLDGVLCVDPTNEQNDDSHAYSDFLDNASPLFIPGHKIGAVITSRLEKYRSQTMAWLEKNHVQYDQLVMLEGHTAIERRELQIHGKFKSEALRTIGKSFFVESSDRQAREIAALSGCQVFSLETRVMYYPDKEKSIERTSNVIGFARRIRNMLGGKT